MTRETKFRGKRLDNGEWVTGYLLGPNVIGRVEVETRKSSVDELERFLEIGVKANILPNCLVEITKVVEAHEVEPETVGEWTGLKDKNGVDIFEGDLHKREDGNVGIIAWADGYWKIICQSFAVGFSSEPAKRGEVIGNVHDKTGR